MKVKLLSYTDGLLCALMVCFAESLASLYFSKVNISAKQLGMLTTAPPALGALAQAVAPYILKKTSAYAQMVGFVGLQLVGIFLMAASLFWEPFSLPLMSVALCVYWVGGMAAGAPWQVLLGRIIPFERQNVFFARRSAVISLMMLAANLFIGFILRDNLTRAAVMMCFFSAAVFRLGSLWALWNHPRDTELPPAQASASQTLSKEVVLANPPVVSIAVLSFFMMLFKAGIYTSAPFFNRYMFSDLGLSVLALLIINSVPLLTRFFFLENWGVLLDQKRMFEGLFLCVVGIAVLPAMWVFSASVFYISFLQVIAGLVWSGFELLSVLLVQRMYPGKVLHILGIYFAAGSMGNTMGGILGGVLLDAGSTAHDVFWLSTILRFTTGMAFLIYLRSCGTFSFRQLELLSGLRTVVSLRPMGGMIARTVRVIRREPVPFPVDDSQATSV